MARGARENAKLRGADVRVGLHGGKTKTTSADRFNECVQKSGK